MGRGRLGVGGSPELQSRVRTWALQLGSDLSSAKIPASLCLSFLICPVRIITAPTLVVVRVDLDSAWGAQNLVRASAASVSCHLSRAHGRGPALTFTLGLELSGIHAQVWHQVGSHFLHTVEAHWPGDKGDPAGTWAWLPASCWVPQQPGTGRKGEKPRAWVCSVLSFYGQPAGLWLLSQKP